MPNTLMHINMNLPSIKTIYVLLCQTHFIGTHALKLINAYCKLKILNQFLQPKNTFYSLIHNNQLKIGHNIQQIYLEFAIYIGKGVLEGALQASSKI